MTRGVLALLPSPPGLCMRGCTCPGVGRLLHAGCSQAGVCKLTCILSVNEALQTRLMSSSKVRESECRRGDQMKPEVSV